MLNQIRDWLPKALFLTLTTAALPATAQTYQYVTRDNQTAQRLEIQINDDGYFRNYTNAVYQSSSFNLAQTTLRLQYNTRPTGTRPVFINACDTNFSQYYNQATNNAFHEPQWQFAVKSAAQRYFSIWYNMPPAAVDTRDPCQLIFTPARIAAMQKLHPASQTDHLRVRMKFGRVLAAMWQAPFGEFSDVYSPEFDLTPAPSGGYTLTQPATVDLVQMTAVYAVTPTQHHFYTGQQAAEHIWGLVYKNPGNNRLRYAASLPLFQYDSVNSSRFLSAGGYRATLVMGQLYPRESKKRSFPNGVPLLPANAQPYLRVEAQTRAQPYGRALKEVFMLPHVNRVPEFEYGYIDSEGNFQNIAQCAETTAECFTRNQPVFFAFIIKDPDIIHEVTGGFYRGSVDNRTDRARIGPNGFTVQVSLPTFRVTDAHLKAAQQTTITTNYYLNNTFRYLSPRWNGLFFDIQVRDRLGGQHRHTYTLAVPDRPYGGLGMGYAAKKTGRPDVRADGSGTVLASHKYINFPDYTRRQSSWYIGTTRIGTSPASDVTSRVELTPARAALAHRLKAPVRIEALYQKGTIIQTVVATMPVGRVVLTGRIDGLYSGETPGQVQAALHPENFAHRIISSELFNNATGGTELESLGVAAAEPHRISPTDWEPVYARAGRFPPATAWHQRPVYQARMLVLQPTGGEALMESNVLTLAPATPGALRLELAMHDRNESGWADPGEIFGVNLRHRPAAAYVRGDLHWEFSASENFVTTLTTITQRNAGTRGQYTLGSWPLPGPYLRVRFTGEDKFSNSITVTTPVRTLGPRPSTGATLHLQGGVFNSRSVLTLDTAGVQTPAGGEFVAYAWEIGPPVVIPGVAQLQTPPGRTYTLNSNSFNRLNLGYEVRATAVYRDNYNQKTTITAGQTFDELAAGGAAPTELEFILQPPPSGSPGQRYAITISRWADANGVGTLSYEWQTRRGTAGEYQTLALTTATYPLAAGDFPPGPGRPEVRLALTHHDATGQTATFHATAGVPQAPAPDNLTLTANHLTPGSTISLQQPPQDPNGIKRLRYSWSTDQAPVVGAATYTLQPGDFNPARALGVTVVVEDLFGAETTVTAAPLTIAQPLTGALRIYPQNGSITLAAVLAALTTQIHDPNGGRITNWRWAGTSLPLGTTAEYTLTAPVLSALRAGQTLTVTAEHQDNFGFHTALTATFALADHLTGNYEPVSGALRILGPASFTPALTLTAIVADLTTATGIYQTDYFWRVNYANRPTAAFVAGSSVWVRHPADWAVGGVDPEIELKVVVLDRAGYTTPLHLTHAHRDQLPEAVTLTPASYRAGAVITAAPIKDDNGRRAASLRHYWEIGNEDFTTARRIAVTTAQYTLTSPDFTGPASWLRRITEYKDWFSTPTTVRTAPLQVNQATAGSITAYIREQRLTIGATVKAQAYNLNDPNGGARGDYYWELDGQPLARQAELVLTEEIYRKLRANATLRVSTQWRDEFGWQSNFVSTLQTQTLVVEQATQGEPRIIGPRHFTPGAEFRVDTAALTDGNGRGRFSWTWEKTLDQGATWAARAATGEILTLAPEEFSTISPEYFPGLRAIITHEDGAGFTQKLTTTAQYHQHQAARGLVTLQATALTPGSRITLAGRITSAAGIKELQYEWATAPDLLFNLPTRRAANKPYFDLTPAALGTDRALRVIVRVIDQFNQSTEIRPAPLAFAHRVRGALQVQAPVEALRDGSIVTALTGQLTDANGGEITNWAWRLGAGPLSPGSNQYTLSGRALADYARGRVLQVHAVHRDGFGHKTTLTAQLINTAPDRPSAISGLTLSGPAEFTPGGVYHAQFDQITDPNGRGTIQYQWHTRGNPQKEFKAVTRTTGARYTLQQADFTENARKEIKVVISHQDPTGGTARWTRTREHQPAVQPALRLHAESLRPRRTAKNSGRD